MGIALITHIMHVRSMRKHIYNKGKLTLDILLF